MNLAVAAAPKPAAPAPVPASAASDAPTPVVVDDTLVPGVSVPKVPGLPGAATPGIGLGDLVAPPTPGSVAYAVDLAAVKGAQLLRTPEGDAWANRMADDGAVDVWRDFAKRHRAETGPIAGWLDTALLAGTIAANAGVTQIAKARYDRERPYEVDPSIKPPVKLPHDDSYPSGHASSAFAAARVISVLQPKLAKEAYDIATQVAASRVYAGVHFPTDVVAGALLGTGVAEAALRRAGKQPALSTEA